MPLSVLAPREKGRLRSLNGGRGFVCRMVSLGFTPGVPVAVVQNRGHGPLIVQVRDCRVALGRGEASQVLVQPEGNSHGPASD